MASRPRGRRSKIRPTQTRTQVGMADRSTQLVAARGFREARSRSSLGSRRRMTNGDRSVPEYPHASGGVTGVTGGVLFRSLRALRRGMIAGVADVTQILYAIERGD